jgi:hypothetical protein
MMSRNEEIAFIWYSRLMDKGTEMSVRRAERWAMQYPDLPRRYQGRSETKELTS